jgi:hypothetical protein
VSPEEVDWWPVLDNLASLIAIFGVPFTIVTVLRTQSAVNATERFLGGQQALRLLPELRAIEAELDRCVATGRKDDAIEQLLRWRTTANRLQGLLLIPPEVSMLRRFTSWVKRSRTAVPNAGLIEELKASVALASTAKTALVQVKEPPPGGTPVKDSLESVTRAFRRKATEVSNAADILETMLSSRTSGA